MISQSVHFAEVFTRARDCVVTEDLSDACQRDLREAQDVARMPPSRAHLKRNERAKRPQFRDPVTHRVCTEETLRLRQQNEHFKRMAAEIGRSRVVTPTDDGLLYAAEQRGVLNVVPHPSKEEQSPVSFAEHMAVEQAKIEATRSRLAKEFREERERTSNRLQRGLARWEQEFSLD